MVADVNDCIAAQNLPEPQPPMDMEIEELYDHMYFLQTGHTLRDCRFRQKFKSFIEQYELRELHFHSLLKMKEQENQYYITKLEQQRKQHEMESSKSHQLTRQVSTFSQTETELRTQLNIYVEKFKQVRHPYSPL